MSHSTFSGSRKPSQVVHESVFARTGTLTFHDTACGLRNEIVLTSGSDLPVTCKRCLAAIAKRDRTFQRKSRRGLGTMYGLARLEVGRPMEFPGFFQAQCRVNAANAITREEGRSR